MSEHEKEIKSGVRFGFGVNWSRFLRVLDDERVYQAKASLENMLELHSLESKSFLDVGSGSGLFSLAARMLGADVRSFDFDPNSVACTQELKSRYFAEDANWLVEEGSVLSEDYLRSLGQFDVVYSWGVLHHTGQMWQALAYVVPLVKEGGLLYISIYNDQGRTSKKWKKIKKLYCSGMIGKFIVRTLFYPYFFIGRMISDLRAKRSPFASFANYKQSRGMSVVHDWEDWLGGYPFEVAKPEEIFDFYRARGFVLKRLKTCAGGLGCNEFIFKRESS